MRKIILIIVGLLVFLSFVGFFVWRNFKGTLPAILPPKEDISQIIERAKPGENNTVLPLKIPDGFSISIYAKNLPSARDLTFTPNGDILVSETSEGKVVVVTNNQNKIVLSGLERPHGITFNGNKLYVAETNGVYTYDYDSLTNTASNKRKIVELPSNGFHFTRSILIRNDRIYISTGSDCNVCIEGDQRKATISSANLDGSDFKSYATGLRNSVFLTLNPYTNDIWATEMGRDNLGDDTPPDEINIIREGGFYGWPYCYGSKIHDNTFDKNNSFDCSSSIRPEIEIPAHSAPLGLAFYGSDLLVSFHGSWNRSIPTGYKIVRIHNGLIEDFITGWLTGNQALGRPVDILTRGNNIYVSDDKAGLIYLIRPL